MDDDGVGRSRVLDEQMGFKVGDFEGALDCQTDAGAFLARFDEDAGVRGGDDFDERGFDAGDGEGFVEAFAGGIVQRGVDFNKALLGAFEGFFDLSRERSGFNSLVHLSPSN